MTAPPPPPPPPSQILSLSMNPRSIPPPTQQDVDEAVNLAIGAGVKGVALTYTWSTLEPMPNNIDLSQLQGALTYFNARNLQIYLGIQVINTVKREVPSDLNNVAFDSPQMATRFHALLDRVLPMLGSNAKYVSIGNEVDGYLAATNQWSTYRTFFEDAVAYIHGKRPETLVGVTSTFIGAKSGNLANVQALNTKSDVVIFTYYPLHGDFQVDAPNAPTTDFPLMLSWTGGKPLILQEVGYPSDAVTGSSPDLEAQFVTAAFTSWRAGGTRIPFFNYFIEHDFDPATCIALGQYYGIPNDPAFIGYLCSLGLRADDDAVKPAWDAFVTGAASH
ncbi:MAG: hypothetical protein HY010_20355 [Acidobacteria bacterium]|nr:hypothetical protein [Acidobacteriota bacterium]